MPRKPPSRSTKPSKKPTKKKAPPPDKLAEYRRKRSADATPEPFPRAEVPGARIFVVQKHAATRLHYDLRLQIGGALQSWAVPKGPSVDPAEKRLAVEVEEHPLEYADFEGVIPKGNYGAGAVIVWDRGVWEPVGHEPEEGLADGKLLFDLKGYKLKGRWTLFRIGKKQNEWLLVKKPDAEANPDAELDEGSIRTGLTVEEVGQGIDPSAPVLEQLEALDAPEGQLSLPEIELMLAEQRDDAFTREGWMFEIKYDGFRLLGQRDGERSAVRYRRGQDATAIFPEIAAALAALPHDSLVVDGEVAVLDDAGRPSFQRLQQRTQLRRPFDIRRATIELPATYFVFDLLAFDRYDLRALPLVERKRLLRRVLPRAGALHYCEHIETEGEAMFEAAREMQLEGIVAKQADSRYRGGRWGDWLKIRADRTDDFVVVGYSPAKGSRSGFGALHLALLDTPGGSLVYTGRVGSGFGADQLHELQQRLDPLRRKTPPCGGPLPSGRGHTWVEPRFVCEVRYKELTAEGLLRQPVFLRLRDDKPLEDCVRPAAPRPLARDPEPPPPAAEAPVEKRISFTNLDKVFWPEEGYTKGDLIEYHRRIAPWLLPYLEDRPVVLTRYPDGIKGKSFFQKDAPGFIPAWVRTERMWSEHAEREVHYFICDDEATLLYLINLGTIPLHLWSSRVSSLQHPDWCILDLDPKEAPFEHVIRIARRLKSLCDEIGLPSYPKTSGSTGIHVLLPLGGQCTYEQSRRLGEVLARIVASEMSDIATVTRNPAARGGKVYLDYVQNGHGRLLVAPYCVRPLPGAPVSTPLKWSEVRKGLELGRHTIVTVPRRAKRLAADPLAPVLDEVPDLAGALERLADRL